MKLSELSTDRALDALCEMTPYINSITKDKEILDVFSEKMDTKDMTILSVKIISASRYNEMLSILLKSIAPMSMEFSLLSTRKHRRKLRRRLLWIQ